MLGFLSVATLDIVLVNLVEFSFQSRAGFSLRRDALRRWCWYSCVDVSIPCWVFSPSRRPGAVVGDQRLAGFQSRAGFSLRRDPSDGRPVAVLRLVSIPCWVFSPSRPASAPVFLARSNCFNPVLGFLSVATHGSPEAAAFFMRFQSRAGFFLRRNVECWRKSGY